jgi:hypothetical protein
MTRGEFTRAVEAELQVTGRPFSRADLQAFLEAVWPMVQDDPDPAHWAREFLTATATADR